jgi:hypothetical protein
VAGVEGEGMKKWQEYLKGYKTFILLGAYIIYVLVSGEDTIVAGHTIEGMDPEAIQKALIAGVIVTLKAWANRSFGKKDGVEVEVK